MSKLLFSSVLLFGVSTSVGAFSPSYDCTQRSLNSVEKAICADVELSQQDVLLDHIYKKAKAIDKANQATHSIRSEQRGWLKGRNECWKSDTTNECIREQYQHRIATLQARYRLVEHSDPIFFACDGNQAKEVVVTRFETDPISVIAEFGDSVSFMLYSAQQSQYVGRNESIIYQNDQSIDVVWGYNAPVMQCVPKSNHTESQ
ncbi:lysozyme inhibitor LprI family protein [Vibrio japonicus]|uniref:Lysozyme inhibitor LprI family protein n=1 Tax=Vibrio japonicus TaxID=1824638 RepID=A0ABY5LN50_9VIBR|nr:lysozyme inhibitor LprI family protein [Vibrio japonicus]UUM32331.1 lysozyme inhibitor LprI family protein [Vibrio japonicus]